MQNLIRFLYRFHAVFLFLLLQFVCLVLLYTYNPYQRASIINSSNFVTGGILETWTSVTDYFQLSQANEQLAFENAALRNQLKDISLVRVDANLIRINDTLYQQQYDFIPAKVINSTTNKGDNYLTLNIGANDGVLPDMGVTGPNGIVGFVKNVSANYCTVVTILNGNFTASSRILASNYFGQLVWDRETIQTAKLNGIPKHAKPQVGDSILTRGASGRYPENLFIGIVENVASPDGQHNLDITVKLGTDFSNIYYVYVIKNILKTEQEELEMELLEDAE